MCFVDNIPVIKYYLHSVLNLEHYWIEVSVILFFSEQSKACCDKFKSVFLQDLFG